mmetsp:Transcript_9157/g.40300  ORF Transcript_9157/g.40300 Transcript_9157/m.40300 type:complete len:305 (-) Transcript_9157:1582-2496(-)
MQLVLNGVLNLRANLAALPVLVPFAVRDVADAGQGHRLRKLRGERGESGVQTADQGAALLREAATRVGRVALNRLDGFVHLLRGVGVVVGSVVAAVLDARDGADADPEEVDGRVRQRVHVRVVRVHAENALERLELLPPRGRVSVALDDAARGVGQAVGVPLVLALVVGTLVLLQVDVLPGPVAEQRHVVARLLRGHGSRLGRGGRRRLVVVVMLLLMVVMLLLMVVMLLLVMMLLLLLLLLLGRRGASSRAGHRLERRRDVDENVAAVPVPQPLLAILRADQHRHARRAGVVRRELHDRLPVG